MMSPGVRSSRDLLRGIAHRVMLSRGLAPDFSPAALAEEVRDLVVKTMCQAMGEMLPEVPVEVEAKICKCWGEK